MRKLIYLVNSLWESLAIRLIWIQEIAGSNPAGLTVAVAEWFNAVVCGTIVRGFEPRQSLERVDHPFPAVGSTDPLSC